MSSLQTSLQQKRLEQSSLNQQKHIEQRRLSNGTRPTILLPGFLARSNEKQQQDEEDATWRTRTHAWCDEQDWYNRNTNSRSFGTTSFDYRDDTPAGLAQYLTPKIKCGQKCVQKSVYGHTHDLSATAPRIPSDIKHGASGGAVGGANETKESGLVTKAAEFVHSAPTLHLSMFSACGDIRKQLETVANEESRQSTLHATSCFGRPRNLSQNSVESIFPQMMMIKCKTCGRQVSASCVDDHSERCQSYSSKSSSASSAHFTAAACDKRKDMSPVPLPHTPVSPNMSWPLQKGP